MPNSQFKNRQYFSSQNGETKMFFGLLGGFHVKRPILKRMTVWFIMRTLCSIYTWGIKGLHDPLVYGVKLP